MKKALKLGMAYVVIAIWILFLIYISISDAASMGGYGNRTNAQKRTDLARQAQVDSIRSYYHSQAEADRVRRNMMRRKDAEANAAHNQRVLESHRRQADKP